MSKNPYYNKEDKIITSDSNTHRFTNTSYTENMTIEVSNLIPHEEVCIVVEKRSMLPDGQFTYNSESILIPTVIYIQLFNKLMAEIPLGGALYGVQNEEDN